MRGALKLHTISVCPLVCRWPNGDVSFVSARNKEAAIIALDEFGDADLGMTFIDLGRCEEGLKEGLEAARLQANTEHPFRRHLDAYMCLGRFSQARELAERLRMQRLDRPRIHQRFLEPAYLEGEPAAAARKLQWFAGKPEEYISVELAAADANLHGQRHERTNYSSEQQRQRCAVGSETNPSSKTVMRMLTRLLVIAGQLAVWGVRPWR